MHDTVRRFDKPEFRRAMIAYGPQTLPIVLATAAFAGILTVVQSAVYVNKYAAYDFVGWFCGFAAFREAGPLIVGLMFSGRVGSSHCAELASMRGREQLDALRVLGLDVYRVLIIPRAVAMVLCLVALLMFADLAAILASTAAARLILGVHHEVFLTSLQARLWPTDVAIGVVKAGFFAVIVACVSTHYGLRGKMGSASVGAAVTAQVTVCATLIFCVNLVLTWILP